MHNHAPENYVCPFCLLIRGVENEHVRSVQSDIILKNDMVSAFVGSHQWQKNHVNGIIAPNEHFENIYDLPVRFAEPIHALAKTIALAMKAVYSCDGISTRQHNEPSGNQDVWHYHVHVTPRYMNDGFYDWLTHRQPMPIGERAKHAMRLREYLAEQFQTRA